METRVDEARLIPLPSTADDRGSLTSIEGGRDIPIEIARVFYIHEVTRERGGHAHIDTDQVIIPVSGELEVNVRDLTGSRKFFLDNRREGLFVPRLLFVTLHRFSPGAVCLVLASSHYDQSLSLRSWEQFEEYMNRRGSK